MSALKQIQSIAVSCIIFAIVNSHTSTRIITEGIRVSQGVPGPKFKVWDSLS